tara:strand:- start:3701 stop:4153 length:453 start_codon:yes stop_codon:yes gene_type:complete
MPTTSWGPQTWNMIHTLSVSINENHIHFNTKIKELISHIYNICVNLPCPACTTHATNYMKKHNPKNITDKVSLVEFFFNFHNDVNKNLKKPIFTIDKLNPTYCKNNIYQVFNTFCNRYNASSNNMTNYNNKKIVAKFYEWFYSNRDLFIN